MRPRTGTQDSDARRQRGGRGAGLRLALGHVLVLLAVLPMAGAAAHAMAGPPNAREYKLKAAFVYNFTKFIRWPEDAPAGRDENVVLCLLADDDVGALLREAIDGKPVRGNPVTVQQLDRLAGASGCHLVFVSASRRRQLSRVNDAVRDGGVLVVAEATDFDEGEGMINLVVDHNKVRFEIDVQRAERAGLKISSKLLKLAHIKDAQ